MAGYLLRRLVQLGLVLLLVSSLLFFLLRLSGDPAAMVAGQNASPEAIQNIRHSLGLDRPLWEQYLRFLGGVVTLNLGDSITTRHGALQTVLERVPATAMLTLAAFALALLIAIPVGILCAIRPRAGISRVAMLVAFVGQSMPVFWLGLLLIVVFAVNLHWLPPSGGGDLRHLILPAVCLALLPLAKVLRLTRSGMLEVLNQDYVRTARAKGLIEREVVAGHAFRNMLIPVITVIGVDLAQLLGGAVVIETVFGWPGLGRLMVDSVSGRDYPVVQAAVLLIATLVVFLNFGVDVLYRQLDPRIRLT
jgi:ABC-type dipeptide/oligopeptide/nickel transport system permease component